MQIIHPDPTRMIDLPGVGPCPRPVDIDQSVTGFIRLKSLRIYQFQAGIPIAGDSEDDEVYILPFGGAVRLQITGQSPLDTLLSPHSGPCALYMAPHHSYLLTPVTPSMVAYMRATAIGRVACHAVQGHSDTLAEALSFAVTNLTDGEELPTTTSKERLIHVVSGSVVINGQAVFAGQTAALTSGMAGMALATGPATVLVVDAKAG